MATSVGQIGLDLVVNQKDFNRQMLSIQSLAKRTGAILAGAFTVKKLVDFSAKCIELGSDLAEVQNVVDVAFPAMSRQIDKFAKNAASQFGLSETVAKRFTGTFGAMAKAFGFNEKAAYSMSTALTGLAGDVASFYNISQDEAYTKLKSVFSGETETLKDLGIVMTQSALDAYALANGYGKTTSSMSEMEKVALRYAFVQNQLSLAAGDFSRTSGSWANQMRLLKLQFDSLRATIGQGLIAVLTPVIRVINALIGRLISAANALKAFFSMLNGGKGKENTKVITAGTDAVAKSANAAGGALGGAGKAAKKAAKDIQSATSGIDELNILSPNSGSDAGDGGSGNGSGGGAGGYAADDFDMGELQSVPENLGQIDSYLQKLASRLKELKGLFKTGFQRGLGDTSVFGSIRNEAKNIKDSIRGIFTDPGVINAVNHFADTFAHALGQMAGSVASVGLTIGDNLLGGLSRYLQQNDGRIKDFLISVLDIQSEAAEITGNFYEAFANILTAFRSDSAKQLTADIIGIFADGFMGAEELALKFHLDIKRVLSQPIIDNQNGIKEALEGILESFEIVTASIKVVVDTAADSLNATYDNHVRPLFDALTKGLSDILAKFLDFWNGNVKLVLDEIATRISDLMTEIFAPLVVHVSELLGSIADAITALWTGVIQPFIEWIIENILPVLLPIAQALADAVTDTVWIITSIIDGLVQVLRGVIEFLIGAFTGDWRRAWNGLHMICAGALEVMIVTIGECLGTLNSLWTETWLEIETFVLDAWNKIKTGISKTTTKIREGIGAALDDISKSWSKTWTDLKESTIKTFDGIWSGIKGAINRILGGVETMANGVVRGINRMIQALNGLSFDIPDWVPGIGGNSFGLHIPSVSTVSLPRLYSGGFVRANTPQLAMIGDNRHYGEIVAPEDKLQAMVDKAVALAGQNGVSEQYMMTVAGLLQKIIDLIEAMDLTVEIDIREIRQKIADLDRRSGYKLRTT